MAAGKFQSLHCGLCFFKYNLSQRPIVVCSPHIITISYSFSMILPATLLEGLTPTRTFTEKRLKRDGVVLATVGWVVMNH